MSHSCRHTPGVVGGGGTGVVVVVVVVRLVVAAALNSGTGVVDVAAFNRSSSIENGVVDGDGHPVNSVDAL